MCLQPPDLPLWLPQGPCWRQREAGEDASRAEGVRGRQPRRSPDSEGVASDLVQGNGAESASPHREADWELTLQVLVSRFVRALPLQGMQSIPGSRTPGRLASKPPSSPCSMDPAGRVSRSLRLESPRQLAAKLVTALPCVPLAANTGQPDGLRDTAEPCFAGLFYCSTWGRERQLGTAVLRALN